MSGTVTLAAGEYGHDRWRGGSSGCTYTFATSGGVTTLTISAGTLEQEVLGENLITDTYNLSWEGTASGRIDAGGFGASPDIASITGGTNSTVEFNAGTLSKVQLEIGREPTDFEFEDEVITLNRCRYYTIVLSGNGSGDTYIGSGYIDSSSSGEFLLYYGEMRDTPSISTKSGGVGDLKIRATSGAAVSTSISFSSLTKYSSRVEVGSAGSFTNGQGALMAIDSNASDGVIIDAEV